MFEAITLLFLFLGIQDTVTPYPSYEIDNFILLDKSMQKHVVAMRNKVFVSFDNRNAAKDFKRIMPELDEVSSFDRINNNSFTGTVLHCDSKVETLSLLNKLSKRFKIRKDIKIYPIVMFNGVESVPLSVIKAETDYYTSDEEIKKRMAYILNVKPSSIKKSFNKVQISFEDKNIPYNIFTLSNIVANDKPWIKWARPVFTPLRGRINGYAYLTTSATTNLGERRLLNLVINVYDPRIKLRQDLLPKSFRPFPLQSDVWFDPEPFVVTKSGNEFRTTYHIIYPFKLLGLGNSLLTGLYVNYEEDGKVKTFRFSNVRFFIPSVIEETNISDLQSVDDFDGKIASLKHGEVDKSTLLFYRHLIFAGFGFGIVGLSSICLPLAIRLKRKMGALAVIRRRKREFKSRWNGIFAFVAIVCQKMDKDKWRENYEKIYTSLVYNLKEHHDINLPSDFGKIKSMKLLYILEELDKVFADDAQPDYGKLETLFNKFADDLVAKRYFFNV